MAETETSKKSKRPPATARHRVMDLLARRDHSEAELRKKLREKFPSEEVEEALTMARDNGWLAEPAELSQRFAASLHRRGKGIRAVNRKLHERGLPGVKPDAEQELEKALELAQNQLSRLCGDEKPTRQQREKIGRFLLARGFESGIVRKVVYEKL